MCITFDNVVQNSIHLFFYIFEKIYKRSRSRLFDSSILTFELQGYALWETSTRSHIPFEGLDIGEEKTKSMRQGKAGSEWVFQSWTPSPFPLYLDSKAAKLTPPSSSHCKKDEKEPQQALQSEITVLWRLKPARHTRGWWNYICTLDPSRRSTTIEWRDTIIEWRNSRLLIERL